MKQCSKCKIEKDFQEFSKSSKSKSGYKSACKVCVSIDSKKYYSENKEKVNERTKKHYKENIEKVTKRINRYKEENLDWFNKYQKSYYVQNKEKVNERTKKYREDNRQKYRDRLKYRHNNDFLFKLKRNIQSLIGQSLRKKGYTKKSRTHEILGCSYDEFKNYLESKFETWMDWENRGLYNGELNYGWDIDHIIPTSSAKTEEELIKLNHYTNLQPLCSKVNRDIKINKLEYGNI